MAPQALPDQLFGAADTARAAGARAARQNRTGLLRHHPHRAPHAWWPGRQNGLAPPRLSGLGRPLNGPGFFEAGSVYRHYRPDGTPSPEGWFLVRLVETAPAGFEHYSEPLGVAFGWRRGVGPNGNVEGLGAYVTPDFAGWREVARAAAPG